MSVPILNSVTRHVFDGREDLREDDFAVEVGQFSLHGDFGVELAPSGILHHQVQTCQRLHHLVQTDDVGMVELLHAGDLTRQQLLGLLIQFGLVQDLNGHLICGATQQQ